MHIDITDQTGTLSKDQIRLLRELLITASVKQKVNENAELSVSIVSNDQIKQINKTYRDRNEATDVLSFQIENPFELNESNIPIMIGDIIISQEKVVEQSRAYKHSFERELAFLAIHGFLHVLGYTHDTKDAEKAMFAKQEEILKEFNLERE